MGDRLGVEVSCLGEEVVLTPSRRQGRHREVGSGGSPRRDLGTEEHEPRMRRVGLGESATDDDARHCQEGQCVNAAGIRDIDRSYLGRSVRVSVVLKTSPRRRAVLEGTA